MYIVLNPLLRSDKHDTQGSYLTGGGFSGAHIRLYDNLAPIC